LKGREEGTKIMDNYVNFSKIFKEVISFALKKKKKKKSLTIKHKMQSEEKNIQQNW